jgi:hypothetical protein
MVAHFLTLGRNFPYGSLVTNTGQLPRRKLTAAVSGRVGKMRGKVN